VDSPAWKHINDKWPTFAIDARSIRLGLALDGVNPFGDLSSYRSTWPAILFITICFLGWSLSNIF